MFICEICDNDNVIYILKADTLQEARKISIQSLKQMFVHHINIKSSEGYQLERIDRLIPNSKKGLLSKLLGA